MNIPGSGLTDIKVSVAMITYNHEAFIAQAIESVLMQRTDFAVELVIGEDCSTDSTRAVVREYGERYPYRVRTLLPERNLGMIPNLVTTLKACNGQYIALLEGDDYWIDSHKLQKQVRYMNAHTDLVSCFHKASRIFDDTENQSPQILKPPTNASRFTLDDLFLYGNFIPTCSVLFRNGLIGDWPNWLYELTVGDWPLHILNAQYGAIGYIKDKTMSVHRVHSGSTHMTLSPKKRLQMRIANQRIVAQHLKKINNQSFRLGLSKQYKALSRAYAKSGELSAAKRAAFQSWQLDFLNWSKLKHWLYLNTGIL